jgi:PmbA protein
MTKDDLNEKIEKALQFGLDYAKKAGATHSEAYGINQRSYNFELEKNKPKHNLGILHGLAFRVIANNALGFAYTSSFKEEDIKHTVNLSIQNAKTKKPDSDLQPFPDSKKTTVEMPMDKKLYTMDVDNAAKSFEELEPKDLPKDIYFLQSFGFFGMEDAFLKNSQGINLHSQDAGYGLGIAFLSTKGFPSYEFHIEGERKWGEIDPKIILQKGLEKTLKSSNPQTMSLAGEYPVIITPDGLYGVFMGLFMVLNNLMKGDKASRGDTVYADKIGEQIAPDNFTLIDDPHRSDMIVSALYDAEGVPTERTKLIDKGVLQTYYLDTYYAGKLNMESNGKATRGMGFFGGSPIKAPPGVGNFATIIETGDATVDEMVKETREGFMLKNFMGIHMSDFSSGRFSVTGSGWYIKNGEIKQSVQDISVSGSIPELLLDIDMISKETKKGFNNEVPYLRISKLDITAKKLDFKVRFGMKILKTLIRLGIVENPFI